MWRKFLQHHNGSHTSTQVIAERHEITSDRLVFLSLVLRAALRRRVNMCYGPPTSCVIL